MNETVAKPDLGRWNYIGGFAIIALGALAALLPVEGGIPAVAIGALLIAAGLIETFAGSRRGDMRAWAMAAGGVTILAGLIFIINRDARLFPAVNVVIGWLALRSVILALKSRWVGDGVRRWTIIAAVTDALLGLILLVGLSLSTLVVLIFGPTPAMVASFAWILALSFAATGLLLLEVASCQRGE